VRVLGSLVDPSEASHFISADLTPFRRGRRSMTS
jgi:hypothetical protein